MLEVIKRDQSLCDLKAIVFYLVENASPIVARRFKLAAARTFRFLALNPRAGHGFEWKDGRSQDCRIWRIEGFEKFLVIYRASESGLEILRVIHSARDLEIQLKNTDWS